MSIALITTTIRVPKVLELYRSFDSDVQIFVTGDRKTPHNEVRAFVEGLGNATYYSDADQEDLGYASSPIIGWNKIMRRNIATLEALKSGADIVVTVDDDNLPISRDYFTQIEQTLTQPYMGLVADVPSQRFNIGEFLTPKVYHRGFPYEFRHQDLNVRLAPKTNGRIGVVAGLWFGDPDIDAMERITNRPLVLQMSDMARAGLAVAPGCFTPFNSQNTAYRRELVPLMMVLIGVGRYDDIWGSYIAQRVMLEDEFMVRFGEPFVWQERNPQNLWRNLRDELLGMENTERFQADLMAANLTAPSVVGRLRQVYEHLQSLDYLAPEVHEFGQAWCDDVERVLGAAHHLQLAA